MESKIIKQEKNPFLERDEIVIEILNETAPSFEDVKNVLGKEDDLVVVKKIDGNFGKRIFMAEIFVYDSKEAKEKIETIPKKVRKKMAEEKKAADVAAKKAAEEEAKVVEETPEEETKEEPRTEETPEEAPVEKETDNKESVVEEKTE